jgi:NAD(P)-dependent dehydrogenase (short-subunit alcohol dehydrogenase family)
MDTAKTVALVTGANKGIGFEVAQELGKAGMTVYLGARDRSRGEQAAKSLQEKGLDARFIELDLGNETTMQKAAEQIATEQGRLDVLVNNAGIVQEGDGTPGEADLDAVRRTFDTNFFATVMVTQKMLPLIKKSKAARIVNVSSGLGSLTLNADPNNEFSGYRILGYSASKAALNMFTVMLAKELRDLGVLVNAADPGYTATDLNGNRGHQTVEEGAREAVRLATLPSDGPTGGYFDMNGARPW